MRVLFYLGLPLWIALAGCTQFPEVDAAVSDQAKTAPPPVLVPIDTLLAQGDTSSFEDGQETEAQLAARADALAARAKKLKQQ